MHRNRCPCFQSFTRFRLLRLAQMSPAWLRRIEDFRLCKWEQLLCRINDTCHEFSPTCSILNFVPGFGQRVSAEILSMAIGIFCTIVKSSNASSSSCVELLHSPDP